MNGLPPLKQAYVLLDGHNICEIGHQQDIANNPPDIAICKLQSSVCLPGFINCHTHLAYPRYYQAVSSQGQIDWIDGLVKHSRHLSQLEKRQIAGANVKRCLQGGTTLLVENTPFRETIEALANSPLKAVIAWEVFGNSAEGAESVFSQSIHSINSLEAEFQDKAFHFTLSPHSVYNVGASLLKKLTDWAVRYHKPLFIHLSEFDFELELTHNGFPNQALSSFHRSFRQGKPDLDNLSSLSPVEYLHRLNCLHHNLVATHLVKASRKDFQLLHEAQVKVISCPRSNLYLHNGVPPFHLMREEGLPIAFATDGLSSNFDLSLLNEIKTAWFLSQACGGDLKASDCFEGITSVAAKHLNLQALVGSLEAGKRADLLCFRLQKDDANDIMETLKDEALYFFLLSEMTDNQLSHVFVDGKEVLHTLSDKPVK